MLVWWSRSVRAVCPSGVVVYVWVWVFSAVNPVVGFGVSGGGGCGPWGLCMMWAQAAAVGQYCS